MSHISDPTGDSKLTSPAAAPRAMRLLDHVRGEAVWREEPPVPDAASLGALDGFRLISSDEQVRINVYIYAELDEGTTTATALQEMTDGDVYHTAGHRPRPVCSASQSLGQTIRPGCGSATEQPQR